MAEKTQAGEARRASAKALLELAERETRGKLKVFLGMAPGVGKTYAMLAGARALKAQGVDVVAGVIETHGRSETAALLDGLEVLPRRTVDYRNRTLMEFDVEAAIARRPKLLLIDEFAHTNAPGQLHPKRYQDVIEVLRAGIDVWTTLNIQHLESLTDVVHRITGIAIRETVPDKVLEEADDIVVVDLPPEELIRRSKEGKVYLPENAKRAVDQYFKASNLTALRELALRRTADRVDEQMLAQLRQQGIEGPWPTAERILVCVCSHELSESVVRVAGRMATAMKAEWLALHVKRIDREMTDRQTLRRTEKVMRLAERLGATTVRLAGRDLAIEILAYAKRNNVTQIVIGRSSAGRLDELRGRSLSAALVAQAAGIAVTVVAADGRPVAKPVAAIAAPRWSLAGAVASVLAVAAAVLIGFNLERLTPLPNLSMIFLLAVLLCALRFGVWSAIGAALLSFMSYNFFFMEPRNTFAIAEPYELFALLIFLVVAIVTGTLAGRLREQADATTDRAEATQALFDFSRKLSGAAKIDDIFWLLASQAAATVKGKSVIAMHDGNDLTIAGSWPPDDQLSTSDWAAARWTFKARQPAGPGTETMPSARFQFRPLIAAKSVLAVLGVEPEGSNDSLGDATEAALQSMSEQAAVSIERAQLVEDAARVENAAEGERLRAVLLSSISHDLRTPLASIVGSVTSLRTLGDQMSVAERADLLSTIEEEAGLLSRFVANLLDMTKLEAGSIHARRDWVDIGDVVRGAVARAQKSFPQRKTDLTISPGLPVVRADATLFEQVMFNLLDNANKYSDAKSVTRVGVAHVRDTLEISVRDDGVGIPPDAVAKVFDKFYRVAGSDGRAVGTGLGLSICAGFVKAMGGSILAESPISQNRGTRISIRLPITAEPDLPAAETS